MKSGTAVIPKSRWRGPLPRIEGQVKKGLILLMFLALIMGLLFPSLRAQGKQTFSVAPMFRYDPSHSGLSRFNGPIDPEIKWSITTSGPVRGSPVLGPDGTIYLGSGDRNLYAVLDGGTLKWKHDCLYGGAIDDTPVVSETNTIYFGSGALFYALDENGKEINYRLTMVSNIVSSPVLSPEGTVILGGRDSKLYALSSDLRKTIWTFSAEGPILSSPALDSEGNIYFGAEDGYLYSLTPSGTLRWKYKTGGGIESSPALDSQGNVYFGSKDFSFYSLNFLGQLRWSFKTQGSIVSSPAISPQGVVYFGSMDYSLYALDAQTGSKLWSFSTDYYLDTSPSLDASGRIYFGGEDRYFYCLDQNGGLLFKMKFEAPFIFSSPVIYQEGKLLVGSTDGNLYCIGSKGETTSTSTISPPFPATPTPLNLFSLTISPDQLSLYPGGEGQFQITLHPLISQQVEGNLSVQHTPGLEVQLSPESFTLQGSDLIALLRVKVPVGFPPGTYYMEIKGSAGSFQVLGHASILIKSSFFPDVPVSYWAFSGISQLVDRGVINGYPDGTFKPENQVTRAEFAKMILLALNLKPVAAQGNTFPDVSIAHWACPYIESALAYGLVQGYPDGTFRPEGKISLAEAITLIVRAKRWELEAPTALFVKEGGTLRPIQPTDWYFLYAGAAFKNGLLRTDDPNLVERIGGGEAVSFNEAASRAQVAVLLSRILP